MEEGERLQAEANFLRRLFWSGYRLTDGCGTAQERTGSTTPPPPPHDPLPRRRSLGDRMKQQIFGGRGSGKRQSVEHEGTATPSEEHGLSPDSAGGSLNKDTAVLIRGTEILAQCNYRVAMTAHRISVISSMSPSKSRSTSRPSDSPNHQLFRASDRITNEERQQALNTAIDALDAAKNVVELLQLVLEQKRDDEQRSTSECFSTPPRRKRLMTTLSAKRAQVDLSDVQDIVRMSYESASEEVAIREIKFVGSLFARISELMSERKIPPSSTQGHIVVDDEATKMIQSHLQNVIHMVCGDEASESVHPIERAFRSFMNRHFGSLNAMWAAQFPAERLGIGEEQQQQMYEECDGIAVKYDAERWALIHQLTVSFFINTLASRGIPLFIEASERDPTAKECPASPALNAFSRHRPTPILLDCTAVRYQFLPQLLEDCLQCRVTHHFFMECPAALKADEVFVELCAKEKAAHSERVADLLMDAGVESRAKSSLFDAASAMLNSDFSLRAFRSDAVNILEQQQLAETKIRQLTAAYRLIEMAAGYHCCQPSPHMSVGADEVFPLLLGAVASAEPAKLCSFLQWSRALRNSADGAWLQKGGPTASLTGGFVFLVGGAEAYVLATFAAACEAVMLTL